MPRGLRYLSTAVVLGAAWGLLIAACSQPGDPIEVWPLTAPDAEIVDTGAGAVRVTVDSAVAVAPDGDPIDLGGARYDDVALGPDG